MEDCGSCCDNQKSDTMMEGSLGAASMNCPRTAKEDNYDDDSHSDLAMDFVQRVWFNYNKSFNNNNDGQERSFSSLRCLTFSTSNGDEQDDDETPAQAPTTSSRDTTTTPATTTTTRTATTPCLSSQHLDYLRHEMAALPPHFRPDSVEIRPGVVSFAANSGAALRALLGTLTGEPMLTLQGQVQIQVQVAVQAQPNDGGGTTTTRRLINTLDEFDSLLACLKLSSPSAKRKRDNPCRTDDDNSSDDDDDDDNNNNSTTSILAAACRSSTSCNSSSEPAAPASVTVALLLLNLAGATAGRQVGELVSQYWSKPCGLYMNGCQFDASFAQALATTSAIRVPYALIVNHPQHCNDNDQDNNNEDDDEEEEEETAAHEQHEQQDRDPNTGTTRRSVLDPLWQFWAKEPPSTRESKHHCSRGPSMIQLSHMDVNAHTLTCLTKLVLKIPSLTSVNSRMTTTTTMKCSALQILKLKNISFDTFIPNHQWRAFVHAILHRVPSVDLSGCRNLPMVHVLAQSAKATAASSRIMVTTKNPKKLSVSQSTSTIVLGCQELILANTNLFQDCNGTQDLDRLHYFFQALFLSRDGDHTKGEHLFHSLLELDLSNCGVNNTVALALFSALEQQQHRSSTSNHPKLQKLVLGTTTVGHGEQHDDSIRPSTRSRLYNEMLDHETKHWMDCLPQISCLQELHLPSSLFFSTSSTSPSVLAAGRKRFVESLARNSSLTKVVLVSRKLEQEEEETYLMGITNNNEDEDDLQFSHQIRAITNRNIGIRSVQEALLLAAQEDDNNNSIVTTGRPDHWIDVTWSVGGDKNNNNNNSTSPENTSNPNHTGASSSSSSSSSGDYYWSNRNLGLLTSCTVLEPILRNHNHSALYLLLQQGIFPHMVAATLRHSRPLMEAYHNDDPTTTGLS